MNKILLTALIFISTFSVKAQDTFSICAWDSVTGQVGSAGATCITANYSGVYLISDVHPGVGVIHTQAYWQPGNQQYGKQLMDLGTLTPQQIIDSLLKHDSGTGSGVGQDTTYRQYGIVDMVKKQTAQFTGSRSDAYRGHIKGSYYSIQGNTLSYKGDTTKGQWVLDSIEYYFLNTPGTLACRLMAALQGAKWQGADKRCNPYGISTISAILRVANPWDSPDSLCTQFPTSISPCPSSAHPNNLYLDLYVNTNSTKKEPIDSLQKLFDAWGGCARTTVTDINETNLINLYPNPFSSTVTIDLRIDNNYDVVVTDMLGNVVKKQTVKGNSIQFETTSFPKGIYIVALASEGNKTIYSKIIKQ